jgi:AraC family transcriptional regulator, regulatory protein of adaptative response / methylphosphotriester-DNA alkyltransferase methyltransferase
LKGREFNMPADINLSFEEMWEKIIACDPKYDGVFFTAVKTTKIYCRPSYKSRKPRKINAEFYFDINEVEKAGFRACKRCQPEVVHSPHAGLIRKVIAFLVTHYKQKLILQNIADHAGVSSYYLERLFKQYTSETPRTYLEKIRVDKASHLLKSTDLTNLEICYEVAFQSPSNFYKVFRRLKHCSPSEYRKMNRQEILNGMD